MDDIAYLIHKCYGPPDAPYLDDVGNPRPKETKRRIYVELESAGQREHYKAAQRGLRAEHVLKTFYLDYQGEDEIVFRKRRFAIERAYTPPDSEKTELYLVTKAGDTHAHD